MTNRRKVTAECTTSTLATFRVYKSRPGSVKHRHDYKTRDLIVFGGRLQIVLSPEETFTGWLGDSSLQS